MPTARIDNSPSFQEAFNRANGYTLATPYGTVAITDDGRRITFQLYEDVRSSIHHKALFSYYQILCRRGVEQINVDHLDLPGLDRALKLKRGNARIDLAYTYNHKLYEVELKTHREVGLDVTAKQLQELSKHCTNLTVVVPRRDLQEMSTILTMLRLESIIKVDTYEIKEDEDD